MFQNNALSGFLFLLGIVYHSPIMAFGAVLGTVVSTLFANYSAYPKVQIENGIYGFNGALVGTAIFFFFEINLISLIAIIIGAVLSTIIMHKMKKKIPAYTAPFNVSTWILILVIQSFDLSNFVESASVGQDQLNLFSALSMSFGEVMFQGNIVTGLIFLSAIFVNSKIAAVYALYGALIGTLIALLFSFPIDSINLGFWGYNAILCSIALGKKSWVGFILATIGILLSVVLQVAISKIGMITLTSPFVIATWLTLLLGKVCNQKVQPNS